MFKRLVLFCNLSAAILCAQNLPPIRTWAEADKLQAGLDSRPDDVDTRIQLLRYYTQQGTQSPDRVKPLRRALIVWMIGHHPENSVLAQYVGAMDGIRLCVCRSRGLRRVQRRLAEGADSEEASI